MDVFDAIMGRRSIRQFTDQPIGTEKLETLLDAARWAPTSSVRQRWRFVVVTSPSVKELIADFSPGIFGMPAAFVVICVEKTPGENQVSEFPHVAACTLAAENIMLAAYEMGIGSCIAVSYSKPAMKATLNIPEGTEPLFVITLGYPAEDPEPPPRLELNEIAFIDEYGTEWTS
jgi:nitroreductase